MSNTSTASPISKQLVVPFIQAVTGVFEKMVGVPVKLLEPHIKAHSSASYDICGIIGLSGEITGSVVVSFPEAAAVKLVESFTGSALETMSPDFADAIGELANMIAGSAKAALGGLASISTPSVVIGKGYVVAGMRDVPCIVIPCSCRFGEFAVEICIKRHVGV